MQMGGIGPARELGADGSGCATRGQKHTHQQQSESPGEEKSNSSRHKLRRLCPRGWALPFVLSPPATRLWFRTAKDSRKWIYSVSLSAGPNPLPDGARKLMPSRPSAVTGARKDGQLWYVARGREERMSHPPRQRDIEVRQIGEIFYL